VSDYAGKLARLEDSWTGGNGKLRLAKSTISNLFRYDSRGAPARRVSLSDFNEIIALDPAQRTLEVEGLATFETIVSYTLSRGFLPPVAPELKHITIGGATVGIGIESSCFRHGFVHDSLIEADVVLPDGSVVTCSADDQHSDLFYALPNSYGTLGYILRAKIRLVPAKPFVRMRIDTFNDTDAYLDSMRDATARDDLSFVEGLFFGDRRFFLMRGEMVDALDPLDDILRKNVFYKLVQSRDEIRLTTKDYIFRYDPEWFWNLPDSFAYTLFRRFAPRRFRNSGFYTKYVAWQDSRRPAGQPKDTEPLIQDWEVPWERAAELVEFCLGNVDLEGRPWAAVPIRTPRTPTLYPIRAGELYFNLGCYLQVKKQPLGGDFYYTRIMDDKCFELDGIKMLYSSTFLDKDAFDAKFNGTTYDALKTKYDAAGNAPTLFEKAAMNPA
jgi:FAD/FMN-containing dehydrogenase